MKWQFILKLHVTEKVAKQKLLHKRKHVRNTKITTWNLCRMADSNGMFFSYCLKMSHMGGFTTIRNTKTNTNWKHVLKLNPKISILNILPTNSVEITLSSNMHKSQNFRKTPIENTLVRDNKNTNEATEASTALKGNIDTSH